MLFHALKAAGLRRTGAAVLGIGVAVLAVLPAGGSASAGENLPAGAAARPVPVTGPVPAGFSSWDEVAAAQQRLSAVTDRIHTAAQGADGAGFGSIVVQPAARGVTLYWKGAVPASVQSLLGKDPQVTVTVRPAAYSERELLAATDRMMAARPAAGAKAAARVISAGPRADASGLKVTVSGNLTAGRNLAGVRGAGMPVTVEAGEVGRAASRADDSAPYFGGANWVGTGQCTTGFAVRNGPETGMLSAAHCATFGGLLAVDGGGDIMGPVAKAGPDLDALVIDTQSAGVIFNGGPGTGEFTSRVVGKRFNDLNGFVCTSGAFSGTRCNIQIIDTGISHDFRLSDGTIATYTRLVLGNQISGANAAGNGDSGGPVFEVGADTGTVFAKGTMTGISGSHEAPCTGFPGSTTRTCSSQVFWTSVSAELDTFHVTLVTS